MSKKIDITGHQFGRLTVLKDLGGGKITCRCECGTVKEYNKSNVVRGLTRSCGCGHKHPNKGVIKDLTGKRFGMLVVLKELGNRKVLCHCDCGNDKIINKAHLQNGDIQSCGCKRRNVPNEVKKPYMQDGTNIARISTNKPTSRSKSGVRGVSYKASRKKWIASIGFKGQKYELGRFDTKGEAIAARKAAEERLYKPEIEKWSDAHGNGSETKGE